MKLVASQYHILSQGAEAKVSITLFLEREVIAKERFSKKYRHEVLDKKLTRSRVAQECRTIQRLSKLGISVPAVYFVDLEESIIYMEYIRGQTVKQFLWNDPLQAEKEAIATAIGRTLGLMHDADIVHGDLTTSNMLLQTADRKLVMIDFGLSYQSALAEDKAVDLYVLERAFLSTHPNSDALFELILTSYGKVSPKCDSVLSRLAQVRMRGRKKLAFG